MKRVLILGGHGFLGGYIGRQFSENGFEVFVVDIHNKKRLFPDSEYDPVLLQRKTLISNHHSIEADVCDFESMDKTFAKISPHFVVHLANYSNAQYVEKNPKSSLKNIVTAQAQILDLVKKYEVERFVYSSSSMVYGNFLIRSPDERHPLQPQTLYGKYKKLAEDLCHHWHNEFGVEFVIMRPSAVYGPLDLIFRVISQMTLKALRKEKIEVHGANCRLDFTYVSEVAEAFFNACTIDGAKNQVFNCTRGDGRTLLELANVITKNLGQGEISVIEKNVFYPNRGTLNIDKAMRILNWNPKVNIEWGVDKYLTWLLEQPFLSQRLSR